MRAICWNSVSTIGLLAFGLIGLGAQAARAADIPLKAPAAPQLPPWQFTLDEDTRFYSWSGSRGFPAPGGAVAPGGSGAQLYMPFSLGVVGQTAPEHKWEFNVRSGFLWSQQTTTNQAGQFTELTDTGLTGTYTYLGINGVQPYASLALNLPTGRSALLGAAVNGRLDPDLVGIGVSGEGFNVGPTLGVNVPVGESLMYGLAVGYTNRGPYNKDGLVNPATFTPFLGTTSRFDPGDDVTVTATVSYLQGPLSWRISADAAFESNTNVTGTLNGAAFNGALLRAGDRYTVQSTTSYDWTKTWTSVLAAVYTHSNKNQVLVADLPPIVTEMFNTNNDVFQVTLDNKFQVVPDVIAGPTVGYMYRNHNSWVSTNALFVPAKTKWTAGGFFTYNVFKDFALNGRVEHYWINQNASDLLVVGDGQRIPVVTDNGWLVSLGGTHTW